MFRIDDNSDVNPGSTDQATVSIIIPNSTFIHTFCYFRRIRGNVELAMSDIIKFVSPIDNGTKKAFSTYLLAVELIGTTATTR